MPERELPTSLLNATSSRARAVVRRVARSPENPSPRRHTGDASRLGIPMTDSLPTARSTHRAGYLCVLAWCRACGRQDPADLQAIIGCWRYGSSQHTDHVTMARVHLAFSPGVIVRSRGRARGSGHGSPRFLARRATLPGAAVATGTWRPSRVPAARGQGATAPRPARSSPAASSQARPVGGPQNHIARAPAEPSAGTGPSMLLALPRFPAFLNQIRVGHVRRAMWRSRTKVRAPIGSGWTVSISDSKSCASSPSA